MKSKHEKSSPDSLQKRDFIGDFESEQLDTGAVDETAPEVDVIISIDDAHLDDFSHIVDELRHAGLHVQDTMEFLGTVSGSMRQDPQAVRRMRAVKGVAHVEASRDVSLPPPEADVQ